MEVSVFLDEDTGVTDFCQIEHDVMSLINMYLFLCKAIQMLSSLTCKFNEASF